MAVNRTLNHLRRHAGAFILAAAAVLPTLPAAAEQPLSFCPTNYKLWGALCMNDKTGDVEKPRTSGPAYDALKLNVDGLTLCNAWDIHITTQIGDFGDARTVPPEILGKAGLKHSLARKLCREGRHAQGIEVYETIFVAVD
jgi:hypothetical protein